MAGCLGERVGGQECGSHNFEILIWNGFTALSSHILKAVSFFFLQCLVYVLLDAFSDPSLGQRKQN